MSQAFAQSKSAILAEVTHILSLASAAKPLSIGDINQLVEKTFGRVLTDMEVTARVQWLIQQGKALRHKREGGLARYSLNPAVAVALAATPAPVAAPPVAPAAVVRPPHRAAPARQEQAQARAESTIAALSPPPVDLDHEEPELEPTPAPAVRTRPDPVNAPAGLRDRLHAIAEDIDDATADACDAQLDHVLIKGLVVGAAALRKSIARLPA